MTAKKELTVKAANLRLKMEGVGLRIYERGGRLALKGTLPPKPDSNKVKPHQQWITLGVRNIPQGVQYAEERALDYGGKLAQKRFDWTDIIETPAKGETCASAISRFKKNWMLKQEGDQANKERRFKQQFWYAAFTQLPEDTPISPGLMEGVLYSKWQPDTAGRQKASERFGQLARFLGYDIDFSRARGRYSVKNVEIYIPSDSDIEEAIDKINGYGRKGSEWQWVAGMSATYNLRDHEAWFCELEWREIGEQKILVCLVKDETKTGAREIWPLPIEWVDRWNLDQIRRPQVSGNYGTRTACQFRRMKVGFIPYALRHAWNLRASLAGVSDISRAAMMGHSTQTNQIYQRHLRSDQIAADWLRAVSAKDQSRI